MPAFQLYQVQWPAVQCWGYLGLSYQTAHGTLQVCLHQHHLIVLCQAGSLPHNARWAAIPAKKDRQGGRLQAVTMIIMECLTPACTHVQQAELPCCALTCVSCT